MHTGTMMPKGSYLQTGTFFSLCSTACCLLCYCDQRHHIWRHRYAIESEYGLYYANSETNETSWERPGDASTYGGGMAALQYESYEGAGASTESAPASAGDGGEENIEASIEAELEAELMDALNAGS